jgi:hypothetical protein
VQIVYGKRAEVFSKEKILFVSGIHVVDWYELESMCCSPVRIDNANRSALPAHIDAAQTAGDQNRDFAVAQHQASVPIRKGTAYRDERSCRFHLR